MAGPDDGTITKQLVASSSSFAQSALKAQQDDRPVFLLHAATALEQLAKAVLARRHPSLIVGTYDFESLLHACGEGAVARKPRTRMKTVSAREAISRAGRFVAGIEPPDPDLELLILVRDGVIHLADPTPDEIEGVLIAYLKASEALRAELDIAGAEYWGEFLDLVETALKENVKKAHLHVESVLAIARKEFEERLATSTSRRGRRCSRRSRQATTRRSTKSS
jgi:hypothetical protein